MKLMAYKIQTVADRASRKKAIREDAARKAAWERELEEAVNPDQVQVECHIRPATMHDMDEVAAIYNQEVEHSYKVLDTQPVDTATFRVLSETCKTQHQPFVVAVADWHLPNAANSKRPIIGFCLVDMLERGITGSYETSTKTCGKITVVVHPDWRRKKIGTALLDVIMISCSTRYSPRQGCQWMCDPADETHVRPPFNAHDWYTLQMEILVKSGQSKEEVEKREEYKWIVEFLEAKFHFQLIRHDDHFYYHPNPKMGVGIDHWLDRLTFEHRCRGYNS